jgi:amylosucrase
LEAGDETAAELAVQRMLMGFALICSFGGLPLLYMGDEVGLLNDYEFGSVPEHAHDNRWLHRQRMDWDRVADARAGRGAVAQLFAGVKHIVARRKATRQLVASAPTRVLPTGNPAVFAFLRLADEGPLCGLFNFTESWASLPAAQLRDQGIEEFRDLLGGGTLSLENGVVALAPYGRMWLV